MCPVGREARQNEQGCFGRLTSFIPQIMEGFFVVQRYWTVWEHGLFYQQDAETTAEPAMVSRLGLTGFMFLLVVMGWLTPVWAAQVKLAWDATTTYTDGTPAHCPGELSPLSPGQYGGTPASRRRQSNHLYSDRPH